MSIDFYETFLEQTDCDKCPLKDTPHAYGVGKIPCEIMLIGEASGQTEARTGEPFVGDAGKKLNFGLKQAGINRGDVYITNAVIGHPTKEGRNRTPTTSEIKRCHQRLVNEINAVKPKVIVLLGKTALQSMIGGAKKEITKVMGMEVWSEEFNAFFLPVLHPAALLYSSAKEEHFMRHIARIPTLVNYQKPETDYQIVRSLDQLDAMLDYFKDKKTIAFDIETNSTNMAFLDSSKVTAVSFSAEKGKAYVVPLYYKEESFSDKEIQEEIKPRLKVLLEDPEKVFVGHSMKFDSIFMQNHFGIMLNNYDDTMIAHHLLDENSRHGLKPLACDFTELGNYSQDFKEHEDPFMEAPPEQFYNYSLSDADATLRLYNYLMPRIKEENLTATYHMVLKFNEALSDAEYRGANIDKKILTLTKKAMAKEIDKTNQLIRIDSAVVAFEADTKKEFNPRSSLQLRDLFFNRLKFPSTKETKKTKAPCTDQSVLLELANLHPLPANILRSRKLGHLNSHFLVGIEKHLQDDGKVHTSFNIAHTRTGRLSSSNPNLQNLPQRDENAKFVKRLFIPSQPDWVIIDLDYSQIELRVLAMLSGEPRLVEAYKAGGDIHRQTAMSIFKTKDITKEMRAIGKKVNFCETDDNFILTNRGYIRPSKLVLDDKILNRFNELESYRMQIVRAQPCVELTFSNGIRASYHENHKLLVWNNSNVEWVRVKDLTEEHQVLSKVLDSQSEEIALEKEAYLAGLYLGDGSRTSLRMVTVCLEKQGLGNYLKNLPLYHLIYPSCSEKCSMVRFKEKVGMEWGHKETKNIPDYVFGEWSYNKRLSLLAGLLDSDGGIEGRDTLNFFNTNFNLITSVALLCNSLGIKTSCRKSISGITENGKRRYINKNGVPYKPCYSLILSDLRGVKLPLLCDRKKIGAKKKTKRQFRGFAVNKEMFEEAYRRALNDLSYDNEITITLDNLRRGRCALTSLSVTRLKNYMDFPIDESFYPVKVVSKKNKLDTIYAIEVSSHEYIASSLVSHNSVIYGEGPKKLANELNITRREAETYIHDYFVLYPRVDEYIKMTEHAIKQFGYVRSPLGRYRRLPDVFTNDNDLVSHALRQGVNFTISSPASDITQTALYKINRYLKSHKYNAQVILTVHDSIVVECALCQLPEVFNLCLKVMNSVYFPFMTVPIAAEGKVGLNYADTVEWDGKSEDIVTKINESFTDEEHISKLIEMIGIVED